jgi:cytochrome P450
MLPPEHASRPSLQTLRWTFRPQEFLDDARERYGETFGVRFLDFPTLFYFSSDPVLIKEVFSNPQNPMPPDRKEIMGPLFGAHSLFIIDGAEHLGRRKLMLPPFHGEQMRKHEEEIGRVIDREIASWSQGKRFRFHSRMQSVTMEVILRTIFGVSEPQRIERVGKALDTLLSLVSNAPMRLVGLAMRPLPLGPLSPWRFFERTVARIDKVIHEEISARRADPRLAERNDVLSMLLMARFEDGGGMSDDEVRDHLVTLLIAGHETTASALAWAFDLLLHDPERLARLLAELEAGESDEYLRAVCSEVLRIRPVVPMTTRQLADDVAFDGYGLPAGTAIAPMIYFIHTRPDFYDDPLQFRPERFLDGEVESYAWAAFGGGVRRCLGAAFAEFEMRIVLREVLTRCRLEPASDDPEEIKWRGITFSPRGGTPVVLVERNAPRVAAA